MSTVPVEQTSPFRQVLECLVRLQDLEAEGKADSPEADELRLAMELPWYRLSDEEMDRLNGLSGDLYMLSGGEITAESEFGLDDRSAWVGQYREAKEHRDAWRKLALLRCRPPDIDEPALAYLRARALLEIGLLQVAIRFIEYAWRRAERGFYGYLYVHLLLQAGDLSKAVAEARRLLDAAPEQPLLLLAAGEVLTTAAHRGWSGLPPDPGRMAVELYRKAVSNAEACPAAEHQAELVRMARVGLAVSLQLTGDAGGAQAQWDTLLEASPDHPLLYVSRGIARYRDDPEGGAADFEQALRLGATHLVWPYFYLANRALRVGDYSRCVALCQRTRAMTDEAGLLGRVFEWEAIAEALRGADRATVVTLFDQAAAHLGSDEVLAHNRAVMLASFDAHAVRPAAYWPELPDLLPVALQQHALRDPEQPLAA